MQNPFDLLAKGRLPELRDVLSQDPTAATRRNATGASLVAQAAYMGNSEAVAAIRSVLPELDPYEAIILGDIGGVQAALASGWDANALSPDGFTPLGLAAFFRQSEIFDVLLPLTRDLNQRAQNAQSVAALHAATAARAAGLVEKLLRAGADPDLTQAGGFTPLHAAAQHGDVPIAAMLLLFGASPGLADANGQNAIDHARAGGHDWLARLLQDKG